MMAMMALCVVGVLFYEGFWLHAGCGVLLGAVWIQSGWIGHDSAPSHSGLRKLGASIRACESQSLFI